MRGVSQEQATGLTCIAFSTDCLAQASHTGPHCCVKLDTRQHPIALHYVETSPGQGLPNVFVLWI